MNFYSYNSPPYNQKTKQATASIFRYRQTNNAYYQRGYTDGLNKVYNAGVQITYHIHDTATTTKSNTVVGFNAYTSAKGSLTENPSSTCAGCYTKKYYRATKTVQVYHEAVAGGEYIDGYDCSCAGFVPTGRYAGAEGYAPVEICGRCDHQRLSHQGAGKCCPRKKTRPAQAAYWETTSTGPVEGWGDCPGNSNNGSTAITYSNVSYVYYPNCGKSNGQIQTITIKVD